MFYNVDLARTSQLYDNGDGGGGSDDDDNDDNDNDDLPIAIVQ